MKSPSSSKARAAAAAGVGALLLVATAAPSMGASDRANQNTSKKLRAAVTAAGMTEHLQALQAIADANGGTRVSGSAGYDESADYAADVFRAAGLDVTVQDFQFQTFITLGPTVLEQVSPAPAGPIATTIFSYSGSGDVTAAVTPLAAPPADATPGCEAADFAGFPAGNIALIRRGACTFAIKATNAFNAGAAAVVIFNNQPGEINGTLGNDFTLDIPVTSVTAAVGEQLAATPGLVLRVKADTFRGIATTSNVIAETRGGDPENVVMAGAHLDSVNAGPGINDNGSGSAALLEIAQQITKVKPVNKVRFALWGAEESGLVGSNHYVANLPADQLQRIALYLNFDMIASPNYVRFVYDGDDSDGVGAGPGPDGSAAIEQAFNDYFAGQGLAFKGTDFSGRSDYAAFIANGIPAGGLFTGAEGIKTAEEAAVFGGTAGVAYDPCYHLACDTTANISAQALEEMGDAVAHTLLTFAFDTRSVNGTGKGHPVSPPGQRVTGTPEASASSASGLDDHDHEPDVA
ncbi:MAG: M28 family metallopeptidase [Candidatus Nanopelagicales bacterium]|jgi:aminopeptidase Y|nr:M28 family metallopeptidase [Candidatus Nanopelagicales bacterium]